MKGVTLGPGYQKYKMRVQGGGGGKEGGRRGDGGGTEGEGSGRGRGGASHRKSSVSGIKSFNGSFSLTLGKYQRGNIMQVVEQGGLERIRSEEELTIVTSA